jgi:hypothetical protein
MSSLRAYRFSISSLTSVHRRSLLLDERNGENDLELNVTPDAVGSEPHNPGA